MKTLGMILVLFSTAAFADLSIDFSRNNADVRRKSPTFNYTETVSGTRTYCVRYDYRLVPRYCYFRDGRGRVYRRFCGYFERRYCVRYETRRYTEEVRRSYAIDFIFKRSARNNFSGPEEYRVNFDKGTRCATVEALNNSAMQRDLDVQCRRVVVR